MFFANYIFGYFDNTSSFVYVMHNLLYIAGGQPEPQTNENLLYWHI